MKNKKNGKNKENKEGNDNVEKDMDKETNKQTYRQRDSLYLVLFILITIGMIVLIFFFTRINHSSTDIYNNFRFYKDKNGLYITMVEIANQPYVIAMYYHPKETEDIYINKSLLNFIRSSRIVAITIDPASNTSILIPVVELSKILKIMGKEVYTGAIYNPYNLSFNKTYNETKNNTILVVPCEKRIYPVIYLGLNKSINKTRVIFNRCIRIEAGDIKELLRGINALDYYLLGIRKY